LSRACTARSESALTFVNRTPSPAAYVSRLWVVLLVLRIEHRERSKTWTGDRPRARGRAGSSLFHSEATEGFDMSYMNCPRCGLSVRLNAPWLTLYRCPRCFVRRGVAVEMYMSDRPRAKPADVPAHPPERRSE
jgi:hypothetical protein